MPTKTQSARKRQPVPPRIVRAWFDTAVNPLLYGLETERRVLEAENWTWRFQPPRLLSLMPVRELVEAEANLDQFFDFSPVSRRLADTHDKEVNALLDACKSMHHVLSQSEALHATYLKIIPQLTRPQGKASTDVFGAHPLEERMDVLAELIVNGTAQLPTYFATQPLWNRGRDEFLRLREDEGIRAHSKALEAAGKKLVSTVIKLITLLKEVRDDLSFKSGEPLVDSVSKH